MRMIGQFRPALHAFRAFDNRSCFAFGSAVGDALMFTQTATFRIDLFAVYAFMHDYRITRRGHLRGLGNRGERMLRVTARKHTSVIENLRHRKHRCSSFFHL